MLSEAAASDRAIRLARVQPFWLGDVEVSPSIRQIKRGGDAKILEPRVMQVLVALAESRGEVISRDDLIERCWDGRIVGENAINRVISQIRQMAVEVGAGSFELQTITKVGYRLIVDAPTAPLAEPPVEPAGRRPVPTRRFMLGLATAVAGLAASGALIWARAKPHAVSAEARKLYDLGMHAQYQGATETTDQAEAYFREATEADPQWADAWGSLAMSYRHLLDGETNQSQWRLVQLTRSAARRALALDPDNAEAQVALTLIRSPYRHWADAEARYRRLVDRFPRAFVARGHLSRLMQDVGRFGEAAKESRIATAQEPFVNVASIVYINALWGAGKLHEAEGEIARAISRWPRHPGVWFTRMDYLTYTGQGGAAIAFASDVGGRPSGLPEPLFDRAIQVAKALDAQRPADKDAAARMMLAPLGRGGLGWAPHAARYFAASGDTDTAFALIEAHFFDRGRFAAAKPRPVGPLTRRESGFLFMPPATPLRGDPRFAALLREIGLDDYWRSTRTVPDFRS